MMATFKLRCVLCGKSNSRVTRLVEDASVFNPVARKRSFVRAGECVCLNHRPMAYLSSSSSVPLTSHKFNNPNTDKVA